jgi:hypothetical protein
MTRLASKLFLGSWNEQAYPTAWQSIEPAILPAWVLDSKYIFNSRRMLVHTPEVVLVYHRMQLSIAARAVTIATVSEKKVFEVPVEMAGG